MIEEVTLGGKHVLLEPLRLEHSSELWPSAKDVEIWRFMSMKVRTLDDLARWISRRIESVRDGTALAFLQRDIGTGRGFGSTSLFDIDLENRRAEIGYTWIGASHRRTVSNTEAKLLLFTHAFETLHMSRVQIKTAPENLPARKSIERLGAKYEGQLRNYLVYEDGTTHDRVFYSVTDSEWPDVKKGLEKLLRPRR